MNWREQPFAPCNGVRLANLSDLPDSGIHEVTFGEGKEVFRLILMRDGDQVQAYLNRCPHFGVPLNSASNNILILPDRQFICAIHCAVFRMTDGQCIDGPVKGQHLTRIEIELEDGGEITVLNK